MNNPITKNQNKLTSFWVGHFLLLHLNENQLYFCTMDIFFRILETISSELICTRLYTLNTYKMSNQCHTMYNVSSKVMSLVELQGHRRRCYCRRWQVRPPYQCSVPPLLLAPHCILQNPGKTKVIPVLPLSQKNLDKSQ